MNKDLHQLITALTARVEALEKSQATPATSTFPTTSLDADKYWALNQLGKRVATSEDKKGEIVYAGLVTTPTGEQYMWQHGETTKEIFKRDWTSLDAVIGALGHPVRLQLLRSILDGRHTKAELEKLEGIGTTGQLYHHLKILEEGGWVRSLQRGTYGVPGERVVPLLTILSAAAG